MPLPANWTAGQQFTASAENAVETQVNTNTTNIATNTTALAAIATAAVANVAAAEANTSTTYADLTTTTDTVTVTIGASGKALVYLQATTQYGGGSANYPYIGVALSGANTVAASDTNAVDSAGVQASGSTNALASSRLLLLTGLTAGSTTFKMKYRIRSSGSWTISNRSIIVVPLP